MRVILLEEILAKVVLMRVILAEVVLAEVVQGKNAILLRFIFLSRKCIKFVSFLSFPCFIRLKLASRSLNYLIIFELNHQKKNPFC